MAAFGGYGSEPGITEKGRRGGLVRLCKGEGGAEGVGLGQIIDALGLGEHVQRVFNSAKSGYEKPHPRAFENLLQELNHPKRIWMIGDNPDADVRGAEAVSIPAILVRGCHDGARHRCGDLLGVAEIVGAAGEGRI